MKISITRIKPYKGFDYFKYIIAYKLIFGILEFTIGFSLMFLSRKVLQLYNIYRLHELSENHHDLLVRLTESIIPNILSHRFILALYMIILGSAKIAGAVGLLFGKNWGKDIIVGLTLIMFPFQLIELVLHPSLLDLLYITVGLTIAMYLINFRPVEWIKEITKN